MELESTVKKRLTDDVHKKINRIKPSSGNNEMDLKVKFEEIEIKDIELEEIQERLEELMEKIKKLEIQIKKEKKTKGEEFLESKN